MHIGYKKGREDRIIKLEILGENNEDRKGIYKRKYARYRCEKARVISITSYDRITKYGEAKSYYDRNMVYRVGEIITANDYDKCKEHIVGGGIHYFLKRNLAVVYDGTPPNYSGPYKIYDANGYKFKSGMMIYGRLHGIYKTYMPSPNTTRLQREQYNHGVLEGPWKSYYPDNRVMCKGTYKAGKVVGKYIRYDLSGDVLHVAVFKDGILQ